MRTACIAFDGDDRIAEGEAGEVALTVKRRLQSHPGAQILIFDGATSRPVEIDFEGSDDDTLRWIDSWGALAEKGMAGPARTKPVTREVTLLPRHWEWLSEQPGGASAALRRLVDEARKSPKDAIQRAQESAYRFVLTMAGDRAGFEEATRALFANDPARFRAATEDWPEDVRDYARRLVERTRGA